MLTLALVAVAASTTVVFDTDFHVYPGSTWTDAMSASMEIEFFNSDVIMNIATVIGDPTCNGTAGTSANSCGLHIHEGFSCDDAGGHYYMGSTDPWTDIIYRHNDTISDSYTIASDGIGYFDSAHRAVVLHDRTGARIGCMPLFTPDLTPTTALTVGGVLDAYPGYDATIPVSATSIAMSFSGTNVTIDYTNLVADSSCSAGPDSSAANSCGIHFHSGTSCSDADLVGGHFYADSSDPWTDIVYAPGSGTTSVDYGFTMEESLHHALVIHDITGARISCTLLLPGATEMVSDGSIEVYPGYTGDDSANFTSMNTYYYMDRVVIESTGYSLDLDCEAGVDSSQANSCGVHLHEGFSCADAGGHFYDSDSLDADPWSDIAATSDSFSYVIEHGANYLASKGRVMVLHDRTGARVACVDMHTSDEKVEYAYGTMDVYPDYTGGIEVNARVSLVWDDEDGVTISYNVEADPLCVDADLDAANSCGIHIHDGAACPTGGHFYNDDVADPWLVAYYTPDTANMGLYVSGVPSFADSYGYAAFVIHDRSGSRLSCVTVPYGVCMDQDALISEYTAGVIPDCATLIAAITCDGDLSSYGAAGTVSGYCQLSCVAECSPSTDSSDTGMDDTEMDDTEMDDTEMDTGSNSPLDTETSASSMITVSFVAIATIGLSYFA